MKRKKLELSRVTVRNLNAADVDQAAGAVSEGFTLCICLITQTCFNCISQTIRPTVCVQASCDCVASR
jgi:hypothetical protein